MCIRSSFLLGQRYGVSQGIATRFGKKLDCLNGNLPKSYNRAIGQRFIIAETQQRWYSSAAVASSSLPGTLSKQQAKDLAVRLTSDERDVLVSALQECQSHKVKAEYEGQLAAFRWRSKFGRPTRVPSLGDVDPTGSYCAVPDDWLLRKYVATVPQPSKRDLIRVSVANAIPFIGFGFLDNFIMIVAGEHIEKTMGALIPLTTMASAALGNTISDIFGIGSAFYVEQLAQKIGFRPPKLTPMQLNMPISRQAANLGRVIGVTIGCILGMMPLFFMGKETTTEEPTDISTTQSTGTKNSTQEPVAIAV